jgi:phosphatidylserine/phosphatidylglycerophosphate/cardiolipin synthase-like enzyme
MKRVLPVLWFLVFFVSHCKSTDSSELQDSVSALDGISAPFAQGTHEGISWQLRLNRGQCSHPPHPKTWCTAADDKARIAKESGTEATLLDWIRDPETTWVKFSYMTFGNSEIAEALCQRAKAEDFQVDVYLKADMLFPPENASGPYKKLVECANGRNYNIYPRGQSWLNHAKIFMAGGAQKARFTSSSANLSGSGTSLHYDNWLLLEAPIDHKLAQANRCFLDAVKAAGESLHENLQRLGDQRLPLTEEKNRLSKEFEAQGDSQDPLLKDRVRALENQLQIRQDKGKIILAQEACMQKFGFAKSEAIQFMATPIPQNRQQVVDRLSELIDGSESTIQIAAHKITKLDGNSLPIVDKLLARMKAGVKVSIVFDDDTILRYKNLGGITGQQVSPQEVDAFLALQAGGALIKFIDTNEADYALMHNKFMIFDGKTIFTGAGNFSKASLRGSNTEQFYILQVPEMIEAYLRGWEELNAWAFDADFFTAESQSGTSSGGQADE